MYERRRQMAESESGDKAKSVDKAAASQATTSTATTLARPAKQDRTTMALLFVAALVAVGGVGFALGHLTAPGASAAANATGRGGFGGRNFASLAPGQTLNPGQFGGAGRGLGGVNGGITGTVQSIDGSTMKVQLADGTTVTINLSTTTTYHSAAPASAGDVKVGTTVTVQIDTSALASESPVPGASGLGGGRTLNAKDILITQP
jgi:hypothetical protein